MFLTTFQVISNCLTINEMCHCILYNAIVSREFQTYNVFQTNNKNTRTILRRCWEVHGLHGQMPSVYEKRT